MGLDRNVAKKTWCIYFRVGQAPILFFPGIFVQLLVSRDFFVMHYSIQAVYWGKNIVG